MWTQFLIIHPAIKIDQKTINFIVMWLAIKYITSMYKYKRQNESNLEWKENSKRKYKEKSDKNKKATEI